MEIHAPVDLVLMEVLVPTLETHLHANVLKDSLEASVDKVTEFILNKNLIKPPVNDKSRTPENVLYT